MRGLRDGVWRSRRERKPWGVGCFLGGRREEEPAVKEGERKRAGEMLETIRETVSRRERLSVYLRQLPSVPWQVSGCFS